LKMETDKKTGPYGPAHWDRSPVRSQKKLDRTIRSSLKPDRSYVYMYISKLSDSTKDYYNDFILYL
jgi:hypothetical protein